MKRTQTTSCGFTLIELLVVIGILAAILLPVLAKAKMKAKRVKSQNNLKQLVTAYISYAHENQDRTMPYDSGSDNSAWVNYMVEKEGFKEDTMISPMCEPNEEGGFGHKKMSWRRTGSGNNEYQLIPGNWSWNEAKKDAENKGGHLATITSAEEWKRIKAQLGGQMSGKFTWLGATDNKVEGSWEWVTGEPWGFEMWHPSEISATQQFYREDYLNITDLPADGIGGWYWASHNPEYMAANRPHDFYLLEKNRDGNGKDTTCSYTINAWAQFGNPQFSPKQRRFYTRYSNAHIEAPVFTEGTWSSVMPNPSDPEPDNTDGGTSGMARIYIDRYDAMANNVAFMDGSVRGVMLSELWKLRWNARWVNPN